MICDAVIQAYILAPMTRAPHAVKNVPIRQKNCFASWREKLLKQLRERSSRLRVAFGSDWSCAQLALFLSSLPWPHSAELLKQTSQQQPGKVQPSLKEIKLQTRHSAVAAAT
eukprot:865553-Pleurochrysis_carterae.AAC.4